MKMKEYRNVSWDKYGINNINRAEIFHEEGRGYIVEFYKISGKKVEMYLPAVDINEDFEGWFLPE